MAGRTLLVAILVVAGLARFWAIDFCLPAPICRPDEEAVASIATRFFSRDFNPNFFDWPTLFMYAVTLGVVVFFKVGLWLHWFRGEYHFLQTISSDPAPVMLIARVYSATAGVVSVWLLYRIADRLFTRRTALIAAACLALAYLHVRDSHFGVTDVTATCFTLAAFLFIVRFDRSGARRDLLLAALWAGLATSTKYGAAIVALPALLACMWPRPGVERPWSVRLKQAATVSVVMGVVFAVTSPYCLIAFDQFIRALSGVSSHLATPHAVMLGRGWTVHLTSSLRYGVGLPILIGGVLGLALLFWQRPRDGVLVASFPLAYYATVGSGYTVFARYAIPLVPFVCLTAAFAVSEVARRIGEGRSRRVRGDALAWALTLLLIAPSAWSVVQFDRLLARPDSRVRAASWVTTQVPKGASVAETGGPWTHVYLHRDGQHVDSGYRQFVFKQGDEPDVLIASRSRRALNEELPEGTSALMARYRRVCEVNAHSPSEGESIYDWQDEFYLPLAGFRGIYTPGPTLTIYVRPGFSTLQGPSDAACDSQ